METLIKSVRQSLNASCKNQAFTEEQWRTFLSETTYVINARPLYPSSNDIWESRTITPNDILVGHHLPLPQPEPEERINPRHLLRSTTEKHSVSFLGPVLWSKLSSEVKQSETIKIFKNRVRSMRLDELIMKQCHCSLCDS